MATTLEIPVPKKQPNPEPKQARVNFLAEESWVKRVDREAKALGLSLSAYIRLACNEKMRRDKEGE
jgi:hypothetical protein